MIETETVINSGRDSDRDCDRDSDSDRDSESYEHVDSNGEMRPTKRSLDCERSVWMSSAMSSSCSSFTADLRLPLIWEDLTSHITYV